MAEVVRYVTPVFRGSFLNLFEPQAPMAGSKGAPKYGLTAVWIPSKFSDSDKKRWRAMMAALDEESKSKFKKPWKELPANIKRGVRDGAEKMDLEGFGEGTRFANITTKMRPGLVDADRRTIVATDAEREKLEADGKEVADDMGNEAAYPGAYYRATVTVYSYDNQGKGVALGLMNVQKIKDGGRLDSRTDAAEDFDDDIDSAWLEEDEDAAPDESDEFLD